MSLKPLALGIVLLAAVAVPLDRYAGHDANVVLVASDRIAVPAARSAAGDAANQPRALPVYQGRSPWLVSAQTRTAAPDRRIEGHWVRTDPDGSGSFGGLASKFTPAQLTPEVAATAARAGGPGRGGAAGGRGGAPAPGSGRANAAGVPYIVVEQPCGNNPGRGNGALLVNPDSGGIHIIEHKDEVILAGERGGVRHIYIDGRPHPPLNRWVPTPAGHSVGRYDGMVLMVDTIGFTPGNVVAGGQRTPATRLTERFDVSADGKMMTVTYTWQDPKIYVKPHSYSYHFDRLPEGSYAFEDWCDASDPIERQSIVPPEQR